MFGGGGFNPFAGLNHGTFEAFYRAMPVAFIDKQSAEFGDKVILPPSALERLASLHTEYPMLFNVESSTSGRSTHCGVLEFIAEEGVVYMPHWMMQNLLLQVGDRVKFKNVSLPKGSYVKLQPVTSDFLDISNPKAVLERTLRSYTCLTVGDCFVVNYNNKNYEIEVKEAKPKNAISVVETDCQVDFEAPKDYVEPVYTRNVPAAPLPEPAKFSVTGGGGGSSGGASATSEPSPSPSTPVEEDAAPKFNAFGGAARRLDGKAALPAASPASGSSGSSTSGTASGSSKAGTFIGFPTAPCLHRQPALG
ncbi:MAG: hypothetical protein WDW36_002980 [Sanguina aurantia]